LYYALLAIATALIVDQTFDNLVAPRIMGRSLGVHPAAVLVVAIIAANLIGLIGLVLAAPVLATGNLIGRYTIRKMFDIDPWTEPEGVLKPMEFPWGGRLARRIKIWWEARKRKKII
jgi:predicted PurR-regulated permease PerM